MLTLLRVTRTSLIHRLLPGRLYQQSRRRSLRKPSTQRHHQRTMPYASQSSPVIEWELASRDLDRICYSLEAFVCIFCTGMQRASNDKAYLWGLGFKH
ncbi:unnamed protein product [Cuscuta campestris]|uniref:Uncharacterized protein n=1 Tax=Cuscuta campestris TaxID=132261 RepID=A0A484NN72_9ASTE|nr:unnamed protein product [Cuscuta campestris]